MKAESKRAGAFSRMWSAATHNWGLKLLALVLAVLVYYSLKPDSGFYKDANDRQLFQQQ